MSRLFGPMRQVGIVVRDIDTEREALARAVRAVSLLPHLDSRTVADAEMNPLIVKEEGRGVVAVDGLVVFA